MEETLHASCVLLGEAGVLIRGPSGSGKSRVARELLADAARSGRFARLVGDDRIRVEGRRGRLIARAVAATAGLLEVRGVGLLTCEHEPAAVVRLAVDFLTDPPRWPEAGERATLIAGVRVPRLAAFPGDLAGLIGWRLDRLFYDTDMTQG